MMLFPLMMFPLLAAAAAAAASSCIAHVGMDCYGDAIPCHHPGGCTNISSVMTQAACWPVQSKLRAPLFAARTLNAAGQYRVTLSLQ